MQRFSISFVVFLLFFNVTANAYLPSVDLSKGSVSARAAFGEEIKPVKVSRVEPVAQSAKKTEKTVERKVVARTAKKATSNNIASVDVLSPRRPSSDLWAMNNNDTPLRMPRMDEITVVRSDALLPEESLDAKPTVVARNIVESKDDSQAQEIEFLRNEVARLTAEKNQDKVAVARPVAVRTPVSGDAAVIPAEKTSGVNVRREVVPMNNTVKTQNSVVARTAKVQTPEPTVVSVNDMSRMAPNELKKAFKKTYLSENKHLSTYQIDERYDTASDMSTSFEGFSAQKDLSEMSDGIRPLEIKISFMNGDSALSRDNYNLLSETASVVVNNPKRAIQIAIPESATHTKDGRKLAARRLAIVEQVLRDTGVAEQRIVPVLSQRDNDVFVLRVISGEMFESLSQQKRDTFGKEETKKTYKNMTW